MEFFNCVCRLCAVILIGIDLAWSLTCKTCDEYDSARACTKVSCDTDPVEIPRNLCVSSLKAKSSRLNLSTTCHRKPLSDRIGMGCDALDRPHFPTNAVMGQCVSFYRGPSAPDNVIFRSGVICMCNTDNCEVIPDNGQVDRARQGQTDDVPDEPPTKAPKITSTTRRVPVTEAAPVTQMTTDVVTSAADVVVPDGSSDKNGPSKRSGSGSGGDNLAGNQSDAGIVRGWLWEVNAILALLINVLAHRL